MRGCRILQFGSTLRWSIYALWGGWVLNKLVVHRLSPSGSSKFEDCLAHFGSLLPSIFLRPYCCCSNLRLRQFWIGMNLTALHIFWRYRSYSHVYSVHAAKISAMRPIQPYCSVSRRRSKANQFGQQSLRFTFHQSYVVCLLRSIRSSRTLQELQSLRLSRKARYRQFELHNVPSLLRGWSQ